jgi:hypothetical protein
LVLPYCFLNKPGHELLPKYIEQDVKQGPSSQFLERAGSGLQAYLSSKELRGLSVRAQVRVQCICTLPSFSVARVSSIMPPSRSATRRSASKCNTGPQ